MNFNELIMENDFFRLIIIPNLGAKVSSIIYKPQNFEVLFNPSNKKLELPKYGDHFDNYPVFGIDDMFPNIDEDKYPFEEYRDEKLPDHGELWSLPWKCKMLDENDIACSIESPVFNYLFERVISLRSNKIIFNYSVKNTADKIFRGFWTFHGLLAIDEKSEILIDTDRVLNVHDSMFLGKKGNVCSYPRYNGYNLNRFLPLSAKNTEKFFLLDKIDQASVSLNQNKLLYTIELNDLPFLGIWKNEGGFKSDYNCALEPSNGFYDSLTIAKNTGKYLTLQPFKKLQWTLSILINDIDG